MLTTNTAYTIVPMLFDGLMLLAVWMIVIATIRNPRYLWRGLEKFWRVAGE